MYIPIYLHDLKQYDTWRYIIVLFTVIMLFNNEHIEQYYLTEIKQLFKAFQREYENDKLFMRNYIINLQKKKLIRIYTNGIRLVFCVPTECYIIMNCYGYGGP